MISRWKSREHRPARPLSNWAIVQGAVIVFGISAVAWTVLLWRYVGAGPGVELDAVRAAGALTVAAGGAAALLLAARRQIHTERDSSEQRITELYTRAVDQLGAEKAPVRLGGLHALERLAQNNPSQRQTIVDVICSYLRMPYTPPDDQAPGEDASVDTHHRYEQRRQELQVRLTAQRILTAHLQPEAEGAFWADVDLDLTGAHLYEFNLSYCHVRRVNFRGAEFAGDAKFTTAEFVGNAGFRDVKFTGAALFRNAKFSGGAMFGGAEFAGTASFGEVKFAGYAGTVNIFMAAEFGDAKFTAGAIFNMAEFAWDVGFSKTTFGNHAKFEGTMFGRNAAFRGAEFVGNAEFRGAEFGGDAWFGDATFCGDPWFCNAMFTGITKFDGARVASNSYYVALPTGWITRAAQPAEGEQEGWLYVVRDEASSEQSTEA